MTKTVHYANDLDRLAHQRARRKMGWYLHAFVYITVNLGLAVLSALNGRYWTIFPALGWGLGLLIHGLVVFVFMPGNGLRERMVQREREALQKGRIGADPW